MRFQNTNHIGAMAVLGAKVYDLGDCISSIKNWWTLTVKIIWIFCSTIAVRLMKKWGILR